MKQCVAPVSNIMRTRRSPSGVRIKPDTMGLKGGSRRSQGANVACCAWRARASSSTES